MHNAQSKIAYLYNHYELVKTCIASVLSGSVNNVKLLAG